MKKLLVSYLTQRDETALIIASRKGQAAVVELLIKANAILDIIDKV